MRAFDPWPGTYSKLDQTTVKFWSGRTTGELSEKSPGTIIRVTRDAIYISAGEKSVLEVLQVQPENRPRMSAHDFIIGHRILAGKSFS
jgi:methionyl-tRNA formyltransferase